MNKSQSIILLLGLLLASCVGDQLERNRPSILEIGSSEQLDIQRYDTVLIATEGQVFMDVDINEDQVADFRFISELQHLPFNVKKPYAYLLSLHDNACFFGEFSVDTVYIYDNKSTDYDADGQMYFTHYIDISCYQVRKNDPIFYIQPPRFFPAYLYSGREIMRSDYYRPDTIDLNTWSDGFVFGDDAPEVKSGGPFIEDGQTVYYNVGYHDDCHKIPHGEVIYIGIRITDDRGEKMGWIKLGLLQKYKIVLFEAALQN